MLFNRVPTSRCAFDLYLGLFNTNKLMKKETLEEAAERLNPYVLNGRTPFKEGFRECAKWQQERMYSEEYIAEKLFNHPAMCAIRDSISDAEGRRIILKLLKKK